MFFNPSLGIAATVIPFYERARQRNFRLKIITVLTILGKGLKNNIYSQTGKIYLFPYEVFFVSLTYLKQFSS